VINVDVNVVLVAIATTAAIVMIGLGFLPFPSRASAIWSIGFALGMLSAYMWVTAASIHSPHLRAAAAGPMLAATGLLWVGLRARRGLERIFVVPTVIVFTVGTTLLILTAGAPGYGVALRGIFLVAGAYAVLAATELIRIRGPLRELTLPLGIASVAFAVLSLLFAFDGIVSGGTDAWSETESADSARNLMAISASVYILCAVVTLVGLSREGQSRTPVRDGIDLTSLAQDRLSRARDRGDVWWSVLDIRLDDPDDLLEASNEKAFARITDRFTADVRAVLPPEADLEQVSSTRIVALVPRSDAAVRTILSQLLERIATVVDGQAIPVRLSASIGVANVTTTGYDVAELRAAAAAAAEHAAVSGGDRWERAVVSGG